MPRVSKQPALVLIALIALVAGTIGLVSARKRRPPQPNVAVEKQTTPDSSSAQTTAAPPVTNAPGTRLTSRQLVLRPTGFEPTEVTWPRGPFFLVIDNRTRVSDITLRIDRVQGRRIKEINLKNRRQRSAGVLDLHPGEYVLREMNHPDWVCRIKIVP